MVFCSAREECERFDVGKQRKKGDSLAGMVQKVTALLGQGREWYRANSLCREVRRDDV